MIRKLIFIFILTIYNVSLIGSVKVDNLKCELLINPIGIDVQKPNLSWQILSDLRNIKQTAYKIIVSDSYEKINNNEGNLWDSGKVTSDLSNFIKYSGETLKKNTRYYWKVRVWTNNGDTNWSEIAYWQMGLLNYKDWAGTQRGSQPYQDWGGRWIGFDRAFPWDGDIKESRLSARYFRKEFSIEKKIVSATAYIIGLGLYELYFNGEKIGNHVLAPVPTDYTKNVLYNTFDVTEYIKSGNNTIGVILGNGRYFTMRQQHQEYKIKTFGFPKLLFHMIIRYNDNSEDLIYSDDTWKGTADGPIRANNEYDGEIYDATKELIGWNKSNFDDSKWLKAEFVQEPGGDYQAQMVENMKIKKTLKPVSINELSNNRYIIDFGQNLTGWVRFSLRGNKGDSIVIKHAESLLSSGELSVENLRDAKSTNTYIFKGVNVESWNPSFVYHGFRYIEVSGYKGKIVDSNFVAEMIYDDIETIGKFESSIEVLNQIYSNSWWGIAGNYKGMPVDCPQRNERQPWLGDRGVGTIGENFIFDNNRIYKKLLNDIALSQKADGALPDVAPDFWRYYSDNMTWPGVILIITEMLYVQTGDSSVIRMTYPIMHKWLKYMKNRYMDSNYILTKDSYGDWCAPPKTIEEGQGLSANIKYPSPLISTAYYYYYSKMMQRYSALLGKKEESDYYRNIGDKIKNTFHDNFYNGNSYGKGELTSSILPLYFDLVPENLKDSIFNYIVKTITVTNNGHLSTGVIGTQWLMKTLTEFGRADIALKLATNKTYPSWGYMIENGATTIWELWNGNTAAPDMNSQNHVMMIGDLIVWFYENLAGIKSYIEEPGFKKIIMSPEFLNEIDFIRASYKSLNGEIKSEWKRLSNGTIEWYISIPSNSTADIFLPKSDNVYENGISIRKNKDSKYNGIVKKKMHYTFNSGSYTLKFK